MVIPGIKKRVGPASVAEPYPARRDPARKAHLQRISFSLGTGGNQTGREWQLKGEYSSSLVGR